MKLFMFYSIYNFLNICQQEFDQNKEILIKSKIINSYE